MTTKELKDCVLKLCKNKTPVPKPNGTTILNMSDKAGNDRFQYTLGQERKKSIPFVTLFKCYEKLAADGELTRRWFAKEFKAEHESSPCNFTTIGGIFVKMEIAEYGGNGVYVLIKKSCCHRADKNPVDSQN